MVAAIVVVKIVVGIESIALSTLDSFDAVGVAVASPGPNTSPPVTTPVDAAVGAMLPVDGTAFAVACEPVVTTAEVMESVAVLTGLNTVDTVVSVKVGP